MHSIRQFEALDAREQVRLAGVPFEMVGVDLLEEIKLRPLIVARHVLGPGEVENGRARRTKQRALITGREKAGAPVERAALDALAVAEHDVTGKIPALTSQPVSNPRARARKAGPRDARVDLVKRRHMIVRFAVERFDEREIVHVFRHVRILFANPRAGLAVLLEAEGRLHQRPRISVEHVDVDALPVALGEFRFGIEKVHRTRCAFHEQPDDRPGFRRIMRWTRGHRVERPRRLDVGGQQTIALQQIRQREQAEARPGLFQEVAAVRECLVATAVMAHNDLLRAFGLSDNCLALSST